MTDAFLGRSDERDEAELEQRFAASDFSSGAAVNNHAASNHSDPAPQHGAPNGGRDGERLDYFVERDGVTFAGSHLIVDLYDASRLDDAAFIESALVEAAKTAGATVLSCDFHTFQPNGGVSGVVVLAESHISIHTWPERGFAALDVFMCGQCLPMKTLDVFKAAFRPSRLGVNEIRRGVVEWNG
ncbi:MAG: adenosylmethionine decarboxylase [Maricaulaceae bacterium]|jgi:S-adenosylmethionine decarboxylase